MAELTSGGNLDDMGHERYSLSPVGRSTQSVLLSPRKSVRQISRTPFKVLDAPELQDDFYLNLVSWSQSNVLGVGLNSCVYLWSAQTSRVTKLCDLSASGEGGEDYPPDTITGLEWTNKVRDFVQDHRADNVGKHPRHWHYSRFRRDLGRRVLQAHSHDDWS